MSAEPEIEQLILDDDIEVVAAGSAEGETAWERGAIRAWVFDPDGIAEQRFSSVSDLDWDRENAVLWLDLDCYSEADLWKLSRQLELDDAGVRAALAPWQRPSVRGFANHALVNVSVLGVELEPLKVVANEVDCFIGKRFLLSAHGQPLTFLDTMVERAELMAADIASDPAFLLYIFLDELIDEFASAQEAISDVIERLENEALIASGDEFLGTLVAHKRFVYSISRFVGQHAFVFHGLLRADFAFVPSGRIERYFSELSDRFSTVATMMDDTRQAVLGTFDIYMSGVSHRTNRVVKTLTIISILVLPASALFGLFGTNFEHPRLYGPVGFIVMIVLLLVLTLGQLVVFRSRGWLS